MIFLKAHKRFSYWLLWCMMFMVGCKKDSLTKATQDGANTFSCRVNGKVFKPYHNGGLFNNSSVLGVGNQTWGFTVSATNQATRQSVSVESPQLKTTGTYKLFAHSPNRGVYDDDNGWYITDSSNTGTLIITRCDLINKIYSGTFSFVAQDPNTGAKVTITDGRFDVKEN